MRERSDSHEDNEALLKAASNKSFWSEVWYFLKTSKKWWMLPLIISFVAIGVLLVLAKTAVAPFIYTLF
jgi:Family of unknown function (DUF5989)